MAISFLEKKESKFEKRQKTLLLVLGFLLGLLIFLLINQGYLGKIFFPQKKISEKRFEKIEIDFNILNKSELQDLEKFEELPFFEIKTPKQNPFSR